MHQRLLTLENQSKKWQETVDLSRQKWDDLSVGIDEKTNDLKRLYSSIDEKSNHLTTAIEPAKEEIEQLKRSTNDLKLHLDELEGNINSTFTSLDGQKVNRNEFDNFKTQADKFMKELASVLEEQSLEPIESEETPEKVATEQSVDDGAEISGNSSDERDWLK